MLDLTLLSYSKDFLEIACLNEEQVFIKTFQKDLSRANSCISKQINFPKIAAGPIRLSSAGVKNLEFLEEKIVLQMPYIEGICGVDFALHGTQSLAKYMSTAFSSLLEFEIEMSRMDQVNREIFSRKINEIGFLNKSTALISSLESAKLLLEKFPQRLDFPIGSCHGDLTLSNVIFNAMEGVVLIDFLDCFLESPLQDVAKINQDFLFGWSLRYAPISLRIKGALFGKAAYPQIKGLYEQYRLQINLLTLFALLRIVPYIKDLITEKWLVESLQECVGNLNVDIYYPLIEL